MHRVYHNVLSDIRVVVQFVEMSGGWSVVLCILAINCFGSYSTRATEAVMITANVGDPLVLEFEVDANLKDSYFTKNDEKLLPGSKFQNGRLVFPQLTLLDAGQYHLIVNSEGNSKTHGPVILKGLLLS